MSPPPQSSRFAVQVQTGPGIRHEIQDGNDHNKPIEAASPECKIEGWFLPREEGSVHGIRIMHGDEEVAAKRKQLRPDVLRRFPDHQDALLSGFKANLKLKMGLNELQLEFKDAHKHWHSFASIRLRLPRLWKIGKLWKKGDGGTYEEWLEDYDTPNAVEEQEALHSEKRKASMPTIAVLLRSTNGDPTALRRSLASVRAQVYPHWQLNFAGTDAALSAIRNDVGALSQSGRRVILARYPLGTVVAPTGIFITALTEGDTLSPYALHHLAQQIIRHPEVDLLYSDGDSVDDRGKHHSPRFATSWNSELMWHSPPAQDLLTFRDTLFLEREGWHETLHPSIADWDLLLRIGRSLPRECIDHIPHVLYHRHLSSCMDIKSQRDMKERVEYNLGQFSIAGLNTGERIWPVFSDLGREWQIAWPLPSPAPLVSIIVPTHNRADLLRVALDSLFAKTNYAHFEIIIVDHASDDPKTLAYLNELGRQHANVRVICAEGPFNWSRLNNLGAKGAKGDVLLFLNNDVEITEGGWLRELASQALRPNVGAVGACLLYPDGTIQHAGIVLGMTGVAGHVFRTLKPGAKTLAGTPDVSREVTAVTGACLAVRRIVFEEAGGFDEDLAVGYNDVDFCLRLRSRWLRNIYTPFARLIHHESVSRRESDRESLRKAAASEEARIVLKRWPKEFQQDAFYSPNLSLEHEIPTLGDPPPRLSLEG